MKRSLLKKLGRTLTLTVLALTLATALAKGQGSAKAHVKFPEESVMIG